MNDLKNFGIRGPEEVALVGGNAKMNEFQAAMGLCNIRRTRVDIEKRKVVTEHYNNRLKNIKGIKLNKTQNKVKANYSYYPILFDGYKLNRDEVFSKLKENGINSRKYFYPITNTFYCYKGYEFDKNTTKVAYYVSKKILTLPLYPDLLLSDVDKICDIILE